MSHYFYKTTFLFLSLIFLGSACVPKENTSNNIDSNTERWQLIPFEKLDEFNPILQPQAELEFVCPIRKETVQWEMRNVLNPTAIVKNDKVYLLYRAQDKYGTSRIGMAISDDGIHFEKQFEPVIYPDNDPMKVYEWNESMNSFDGVEDPRIVEDENGRYIMTYTAYDGKTARLCSASSIDLVNWTKHGLVLSDSGYTNTWSKSGAIIAKQEGTRMIATKINGKYWMYFGDTNLYMAYSEDLVNWDLVESEEYKRLVPVLHPRPGYFDSRLVEPGPFALLTDQRVLLIYNASNTINYNDKQLPKFTYAAGQALFDKNAPYKLLDRSDSYFIKPEKDYERIGEVNEVC
ncbi:MAG: glycosidase, partial [Saprospiraceae bacterium]|nr:glycosidase [Saprospiraceae bacterium]